LDTGDDDHMTYLQFRRKCFLLKWIFCHFMFYVNFFISMNILFFLVSINWNHPPTLTSHLGEISLDLHHLDSRHLSQDHLQRNFRGWLNIHVK
jgi:hypothetical protein